MFPTDAITAASGGANATVLFYSARTFFFFVPVARFTLSGFRLFRRRWIARQLPIRIIWQKVPRTSFQTSLSLSRARWNAHTHTIAFRLLPPLHPFFSLSRSALSFSFPVYSDSVHLGILVCYVHRPICSIKAFDWLAGQRDHALFSKREIYRSSSNRNHLFFPLFGAFPPNV